MLINIIKKINLIKYLFMDNYMTSSYLNQIYKLSAIVQKDNLLLIFLRIRKMDCQVSTRFLIKITI
jgi:hypothetical protein